MEVGLSPIFNWALARTPMVNNTTRSNKPFRLTRIGFVRIVLVF
jgi:hypothetical protein